MPDSLALYAGIGCRKGCDAAQLSALLSQTLERHGLPLSAVRALASIAGKAREPGLLALAGQLQVPLLVFDVASLEDLQPLLSHRSAIAFAHSGCWGVAESAALAAARQVEGRCALRVTRQVSGPATLALAWRG
ncbi:cobalamin biosynthesis protein [Pseudomonas sp.]|uniref:cobalamin biosynthesis protein n=1 Tax=Pseudomonas sp. TaxID=306 RepID=UPI0028ADDBC7|nr:cobalamin biosynthesis protein [Pseudomonas sp.]